MKKCALYCTVCVLVGVFLLCWQDSTTRQETPSVTPAIQTTTTSIVIPDEVDIAHTDDVLQVLQTLKEAGDVSINYTHSVTIDGVEYEMDYLGSQYNYDVDRGHTAGIIHDQVVDLWYDETRNVLTTDSTDNLDSLRNAAQASYRKHVSTISLICNMIANGDACYIADREGYTVYKVTSYAQLAEDQLLHVTVDSDVRVSNWVVHVPDDPNGVYTAVLVVFPNENQAGITREKYFYTFQVNTGFKCNFPSTPTDT